MISSSLLWEPLQVFFCFTFESLKGDLEKIYHGTRNICEQVISCILKKLFSFRQYILTVDI